MLELFRLFLHLVIGRIYGEHVLMVVVTGTFVERKFTSPESKTVSHTSVLRQIHNTSSPYFE